MNINKLLSASALIAFGMLAGRMLGFLREMFLAARFGAGSEANTAISLLLIPDFITSLLIGSAISSVLIPAFAERDKERALALFWQTLLVGVVSFSILAFVIGLFVPSDFLAIALYSLPVTAATGVFTAYLQHKGWFIVPAFSTVIFNVIILGSLWFLPPNLFVLALAVILASLARLVAHSFVFWRDGERIATKSWEFNMPLIVSYAQSTASNMLGILILYTPFALVALLSLSGFALFNYSFKLLTFPSILIQTVIQMALLPWFVGMRKDSGNNQAYTQCLQIAWIISLAVCLAVTLSADAIAALCFGYGKMTLQDVAVISKLLAIGIWTTPSIVMLSVWQQIFYAHQKPKPVLIANIIMALFIVPLCWIGHILAGSAGMLIGFVVAQIIPVFMLASLGKRYVKSSSHSMHTYIKMSLATLAAFLPLAILYSIFSMSSLFDVVFAIIIGMLSLFSGLYFFQPIKERVYKLIAATLE